MQSSKTTACFYGVFLFSKKWELSGITYCHGKQDIDKEQKVKN